MARSDPARGCAGPGPSVSFFSRGRQTGQRGQRDWAVFHKALVSLLTPWLSEWPELKLRGNAQRREKALACLTICCLWPGCNAGLVSDYDFRFESWLHISHPLFLSLASCVGFYIMKFLY